MNKSFFILLLVCAMFPAIALAAEINVAFEQLDYPGPGWKFTRITGPSVSDYGREATVTIADGALSRESAKPSVLTDGRMPVSKTDTRSAVSFDGANKKNGKILFDLKKPIPIAMVATYSIYGNRNYPGECAPQVYALYGSDAETQPGTGDLSAWKLLANVDTRPNLKKAGWGGRHGVNITDSSGIIGSYRWLLFDVSPTTKQYYPETHFVQTPFSEIDIHTKETLKTAGDAPANRPSRVKRVIVVFKTHFDIGYTDTVEKVVNDYRTRFMDEALHIMEETRALPPEKQFVWTVPGWPMKTILGEGQTPERRAKIEDAIRAGRLVWHALPFTTETESLDIEELEREFVFSSELAKEFGQPLPLDAKMTDVPSHSWIIPTLLKNAGVEFLHLGCNSSSHSPDIPDLFWWEGPDGSRMLTFYSHLDYGTDIVPPDDWAHETWLAMIMTGDNQGPPEPEEVEKLFKRAADEMPGVEIRLGRLSDFADEIRKENPELPIVRGDMPDTWIHGVMTLPQGTKMARNARPMISALEKLDTSLRLWGLKPGDAQALLADAYENSLLYGEHTWGLNGAHSGFRYGDEWRKAYDAGVYAKAEKTFDDHFEYIRKAQRHTAPALEERMDMLARAVGVGGRRVVVYNPLPWRRDAIVALPAAAADVAALRDAAGGEASPVSRMDGGAVFVARDLPPMGYKTYVPADYEPRNLAQQPANVLENDSFRATLDPGRGGIRSLVDKKSGRELVDSSEYNLGQYLFQKFDADDVAGFINSYSKSRAEWVYNDFGKQNLPGTGVFKHTEGSPSNFNVSIERDGVRTVAVMTAKPGGMIPDTTGLRVTLYDGLPFMDVEWFVENRTPDPWPEAGWLVLPFKVDRPQFRLSRLASIVDPAKDVIAGTNHWLLHLATGMLAENEQGGVGLVAMDSPLMSIGEPGIWKFSEDRVPDRSMMFVNLFNNMWSTNFRMWQDGSWTSRVRIWPVAAGENDEKSLIAPGWEARTACPAAYYDGAAGKLPQTQSGLSLSCRGVLVTTFEPEPGGGVLLHLWEQAGGAGPCEVQLPEAAGFKTAAAVDLRGTPRGETIPVENGRFKITLRPFAPMAFVLK